MPFTAHLNAKISAVVRRMREQVKRQFTLNRKAPPRRLARNVAAGIINSSSDDRHDLALDKGQKGLLEVGRTTPRFLARATRKDFECDGSFHQAVGRVLLVAQLFAVMPVKGVTSPHVSHLSFAWYNLRTLYSIAFIVMTGLQLGLCVYDVRQHPVSFNTLAPLIFYSAIVVVCLSALNLARKWPRLMRRWSEVERSLPPYRTQMAKRRLAHRLSVVMLVAMMLSMGETLMNLLSVVYTSRRCPITSDPVENYFVVAFDQLFNVFDYTPGLALLAKIEDVLATFTWNYMDVFVMIVSIGLAALFEQLNDDLLRFKGIQMPSSYWSERRLQYRKVCLLCEEVDDAIAIITMASFSNNLYFICVQLLKSLNKIPHFVNAMYFYCSLFFLLGRTLAVSLYTAAVNDESRKPLRVLRCVPRASWCSEVRRFAAEISNELVALSGMKFFHLTRKLVLSVAGTLVTYELVLIQFHEETNFRNCTINQTN